MFRVKLTRKRNSYNGVKFKTTWFSEITHELRLQENDNFRSFNIATGDSTSGDLTIREIEEYFKMGDWRYV